MCFLLWGAAMPLCFCCCCFGCYRVKEANIICDRNLSFREVISPRKHRLDCVCPWREIFLSIVKFDHFPACVLAAGTTSKGDFTKPMTGKAEMEKASATFYGALCDTEVEVEFMCKFLCINLAARRTSLYSCCHCGITQPVWYDRGFSYKSVS